MIRNRMELETLLRFVAVDPVTGCWNWTRSLQTGGYGQIQISGRNWLAHRLSWFLHHYRLPVGLLMHSCDNRRCVNPDHLSEGTHRQNWEDAVAKGRADPMELSRHSHKPRKRKLSDAQVIDIKASTDSYAACAKRHRISFTHCWKIRNGQRKQLVG